MRTTTWITSLLLVLVGITSFSVYGHQCTLNRLDVVPCRPKSRVTIPGPGTNQYGVYSTRIKSGRNGVYCKQRRKGHVIADIEDLNSSGLKLVFSPGFEREPKQMYVNQMLAEYNVDCGTGKSAYFTIMSLNLEPQNCHDDASGTTRCQDYIEVSSDNGHVREFCGSDVSNGLILLGTGHFRMRLRTSDSSRYPGFSAYIVCYAERSSKSAGIAPEGTCTRVRPNDPFAQEHRLENVNQESYSTASSGVPDGEVLTMDLFGYKLGQLTEERFELAPLEDISIDRLPVTHLRPSLDLRLNARRKKNVRLRGRAIAPPVLALTASEKKVLDTLVNPLFKEAFQIVRSRTLIWPPPEFEEDDDDEDVLFTPSPRTLQPWFLLPVDTTIAPVKKIHYIREPLPIQEPFVPRLYKRSTSSLDTLATRVAVAYQDACNPVLQAATKSFMTIARRLNPLKLQSIKDQVMREQRVLPAL